MSSKDTSASMSVIVCLLVIGMTHFVYADSPTLTEATNRPEGSSGTSNEIVFYCTTSCGTSEHYPPTMIESFVDCMKDSWCQERAMFAGILGTVILTIVGFLLSFPIEYLIEKIKSRKQSISYTDITQKESIK